MQGKTHLTVEKGHHEKTTSCDEDKVYYTIN